MCTSCRVPPASFPRTLGSRTFLPAFLISGLSGSGSCWERGRHSSVCEHRCEARRGCQPARAGSGGPQIWTRPRHSLRNLPLRSQELQLQAVCLRRALWPVHWEDTEQKTDPVDSRHFVVPCCDPPAARNVSALSLAHGLASAGSPARSGCGRAPDLLSLPGLVHRDLRLGDLPPEPLHRFPVSQGGPVLDGGLR